DFSLRIQPVLLDDDALYQCQVSASDGVPGIRSHTARLTVYVPPDHPRVKPPVLRTTAGMTVTLECESSGGRPQPEIQWVDDSRRETIRTGSLLATETMSDGKRVTVRSRLSFTPRRSHHNSSLTCLTSNQALSSPLSSSIQLSVLFPPEVCLHVRPQQLVEGDDANFVCSAQANPSVITYRWYHNSQELQNETSRTMKLHKISRNLHQDAISCEVSNKVGTSKKTQSVHVQYGPMFRSLPRDVMAETGKEVALKCDVDSNPPATIVWHQEGSDTAALMTTYPEGPDSLTNSYTERKDVTLARVLTSSARGDNIIGSGNELVVSVSRHGGGVQVCGSGERLPGATGPAQGLGEGAPDHRERRGTTGPDGGHRDPGV
ncbi:irregular chiasm C-roughest protein-like, partial [Homarus americanus]|uniref:irregular chiasm C-roughest protein-like n=1 Tax=Homarus americanus TaxID=6706 RepID=UPI001C44EF16